MSLKEHLQRQLAKTRSFTEQALADFKTPAQWMWQVHEGANHALWFVGHMAHSDNFFISLIAPQRAKSLAGFPEKFGVGSSPSGKMEDYPMVEEVLAAFRERRTTLLSILDELAVDQLTTKTPEGAPEFLPDFAAVFEAAIWHEGLHSGQLSVARKSLGFPSIM